MKRKRNVECVVVRERDMGTCMERRRREKKEAVERVLEGKGKDWMKEGEGGRDRRERGERREGGRERRK